jgi:hypothetical protein
MTDQEFNDFCKEHKRGNMIPKRRLILKCKSCGDDGREFAPISFSFDVDEIIYDYNYQCGECGEITVFKAEESNKIKPTTFYEHQKQYKTNKL